MLPNSWTTGAKLVIFNEITKFSGPKDASFFRRRDVFLAIFRDFFAKKFWRFTNNTYICSPKVKETSFTHADVVKW